MNTQKKSIATKSPESARQKISTSSVMKALSKIPLCPVCGGHRFKRSKLYPEFKYCKVHGIRMHIFDFTQFEPMFNAMSMVNLFLSYCDLFKVKPVFEPGLDISMDLVDFLQEVTDTFSKLKGVYYDQ
ncbi:MAG: hypothetical protein C4518_08490 [Desulfobacteraceae bacterium]|nr:MAG: hypothetical protein C4518_08490 [Desulfobacteraceae bacterium]